MAAFGTQFTAQMVSSDYRNGQWSDLAVVPVEPISLHPATHVLHYASECFEGLKAYRTETGTIHLFRPDRHVQRMLNSAALLLLPIPDAQTLSRSLHMAVAAVVDDIRPIRARCTCVPRCLGTEEDIGAAARPAQTALYYVLTSPVGDYFAGGLQPCESSWTTRRCVRRLDLAR